MRLSTLVVSSVLAAELRTAIIAGLQVPMDFAHHEALVGGDLHTPAKLGIQAPFLMRVMQHGKVKQMRSHVIVVQLVRFYPFSIKEPNPQISCLMIANIVDPKGEETTVSIRWRFNLNSNEQTNGYINYL